MAVTIQITHVSGASHPFTEYRVRIPHRDALRAFGQMDGDDQSRMQAVSPDNSRASTVLEVMAMLARRIEDS